MEKRIPGNLNITVDGIDAFELISCLPEIAISAGSACSSHAIKIMPSHVLKSIALSDSEIKSSFRVGIGRFNNSKEITLAANILIKFINIWG